MGESLHEGVFKRPARGSSRQRRGRADTSFLPPAAFESITRAVKHLQYGQYGFVSVVVVALFVTGCGRVREAEPLKIERVPQAVDRAPPTIRRAALEDVLGKGPGRFFERMPVVPYKQQGRFVGFQIVQLYAQAPPHPEGVHVGDVVTAINGLPIARPNQFMKVWKEMHGQRVIEVDVLRRSAPVRVVYRVVD